MSRPQIQRLEDWTYQVEGFDDPFPSVTNIIKATVPKELAWWGMQVGVQGTIDLLKMGYRIHPAPNTADFLIAKLTEHKLTVNDTLKKAGARGTEVHDILETYGKTGNLPETISASAAGYAKALVLWLMENQPEFYEQEIKTASPTYRYAGTFDGKAILGAGKYKGSYMLLDIKTSKRVYKDQHYPQLEAYEQAEIELGENPTDLRMVVRLADTGKYQMSVSTDTFNDFKVLLDHYNSIQGRKQRGKKK